MAHVRVTFPRFGNRAHSFLPERARVKLEILVGGLRMEAFEEVEPHAHSDELAVMLLCEGTLPTFSHLEPRCTCELKFLIGERFMNYKDATLTAVTLSLNSGRFF
jgi:hypothetical protein